MKKCWDEKFEKRPEFSFLVHSVGNMLTDSYKKVIYLYSAGLNCDFAFIPQIPDLQMLFYTWVKLSIKYLITLSTQSLSHSPSHSLTVSLSAP